MSYLENVVVKNISGVNKNFQDKKNRIKQYGDAKKCFSCKATDHIKINCPYLETECKNCKKKVILPVRWRMF